MRKYLSLRVSLSKSITAYVQHKYLTRVTNFLNSSSTMGNLNCKMFSSFKTPNTMENQDDFVEGVVCQDSDIQENEMKVFDLKDAGKILLVRQKDKLTALGTKCTHYGAPLVNGALGDGRIRCPWHGACFNIANGDIEDFPGLDSLPCYQVTVENNNVTVRARKSQIESNKRIKAMCKRDEREATTIIIIGGGPSGAICAETLRQEGFNGRLVLIAKENCLPYDRVKLSKDLNADINKIELRSQDFYLENNIEILMNQEVTSVNTKTKTLTLSENDTIAYDCLYVATGSKPRKLNIPGSDLRNVSVLREYEHAKLLSPQIGKDKHVVILGTSFIGMEVAAFCSDKVEKVTVIGRGSVPFKPLFGDQIGARLMEMFKEKNVNFIMNSGLKSCVGEVEKLTNVVLIDGTVIKADICIMGVGSTFCTEFLVNSGVDLNNDGSVTVNEFMETSIKGVYAGGDIANAPIYINNNEHSTVGHFGLAHYHGKIAAMNMLGKSTPLKAVPYFWTMLFGKSIRYAGHGSYDDVKIIGELEEMKFLAFYLKNGKVIAMASCMRDPVVSQFAEYLFEGKHLYWKDIESDPLRWTVRN